jgi:hypothetical protein
MERPRADSEEKHGPGQIKDGRRSRPGGTITLKEWVGSSSRSFEHSVLACRYLGRPPSNMPGGGGSGCAAATDTRGNDRNPDGRRRRLPARPAPSRGHLSRAIGRDLPEGKGPPTSAGCKIDIGWHIQAMHILCDTLTGQGTHGDAHHA